MLLTFSHPSNTFSEIKLSETFHEHNRTSPFNNYLKLMRCSIQCYHFGPHVLPVFGMWYLSVRWHYTCAKLYCHTSNVFIYIFWRSEVSEHLALPIKFHPAPSCQMPPFLCSSSVWKRMILWVDCDRFQTARNFPWLDWARCISLISLTSHSHFYFLLIYDIIIFASWLPFNFWPSYFFVSGGDGTYEKAILGEEAFLCFVPLP